MEKLYVHVEATILHNHLHTRLLRLLQVHPHAEAVVVDHQVVAVVVAHAREEEVNHFLE